jgi:hypothetical protein
VGASLALWRDVLGFLVRNRGPTDAITVLDPNCMRVTIAQIKTEQLDESLRR